MHELEIIAEQSDRHRLVLRRVGDGADGHQPNTPDDRFGIAVTEEVLKVLGLKANGKTARLLADIAAADDPGQASGDTGGPKPVNDFPPATPADRLGDDDDSEDDRPAHREGADTSTATPALSSVKPDPRLKPGGTPSAAEQATGTREKIRVDARKPAPLKIPPKEIQKKLRSGSSVEELAEICGVPENRIMPFALPVLHERSRVAQLAKQAHPVRSDGPVRLTLAEVLAAALVARDTDPSDAVWDSHRDTSGQWIVTVTWPGNDRPAAAWAFTNKGISSPTAVPNNPLAREITEPYPPGPRHAAPEMWDDGDDEDDDTGTDTTGDGPASTGVHSADTPDRSNVSSLRRSPTPTGQGALIDSTDQQPRPRKRKKRAETPHWEDVLLGVRTSKKNPRK